MLCESFLLISHCLHAPLSPVPGAWRGSVCSMVSPQRRRRRGLCFPYAIGTGRGGNWWKATKVTGFFVCLFFKLMVFLLKQYIMFITPDLLLCFGFTFICVEMGPYPAKLCSIVQKQCLQTLTHAGSPVCPVHSPTGELQVLPGTVLIECMVQEPFSCGYVAFVQRSSHTCLYSNMVIEFCEAVCHCTSLPLTFVETASGNSCSFLQKRAEASRELRVVFSALSNGGRVLLLKM